MRCRMLGEREHAVPPPLPCLHSQSVAVGACQRWQQAGRALGSAGSEEGCRGGGHWLLQRRGVWAHHLRMLLEPGNAASCRHGSIPATPAVGGHPFGERAPRGRGEGFVFWWMRAPKVLAPGEEQDHHRCQQHQRLREPAFLPVSGG
ncbi:uncharacterized protein ACIB01_000919 [Guaruba guarouba]